ncbi:hypothetical protein J4221_04795 [Candidatus Pacearchaeota archaeon]|nr:hypothetical protein [Candidatus Pacearchaeota archaeon]
MEKEKINEEYSSKGERIIAEILKKYKISFIHNKEIHLIERHKNKNFRRIWYPDFCLQDYDLYIEYIGKTNDLDYMEGVRKKIKTFAENKIKVLYIYFDEIWEQKNSKWYLKKDFEYGLILRIAFNSQ